MRKIVIASTILMVSLGVALADEFGATITGIEGNKVSFTKKAKKKGEAGEKGTLVAADNVKVSKGKFNKDTKKVEAGDAIEGGLKGIKLGDKGSPAVITTEGEKITAIIVTTPKKKPDAK